MKNRSSVRKTFLKLTKHTQPNGHEAGIIKHLPQYLKTDTFGNKFLEIGDSDVMFTCHLDTADTLPKEVNHVFTGNIVKSDGTTILGADDRSGVTLMLHMIKNSIPGLYYFFLGEECGCLGSKWLSKQWKDSALTIKYKKCIAFDRKGFKSVITHQGSQRSCSQTFATALSKELNALDKGFEFAPDDTGMYTDSAQFMTLISECTNISVGYLNQHMMSESQDLDFLDRLAKAIINIKWSELPTERDFTKTEYKTYTHHNSGYNYYDYDNGDSYVSNRNTHQHTANQYVRPNTSAATVFTPIVNDEPVRFYDEKYAYVSLFEFEKGVLKSVSLAASRILYEKTVIRDLLATLNVSYENFEWDGLTLTVKGSKEYGNTSTLNRLELYEFLPEFNYKH